MSLPLQLVFPGFHQETCYRKEDVNATQSGYTHQLRNLYRFCVLRVKKRSFERTFNQRPDATLQGMLVERDGSLQLTSFYKNDRPQTGGYQY